MARQALIIPLAQLPPLNYWLHKTGITSVFAITWLRIGIQHRTKERCKKQAVLFPYSHILQLCIKY
jgi:hypothetical protein